MKERISKIVLLISVIFFALLLSFQLFIERNTGIKELRKIDIGKNTELIFFAFGEADSTLIRQHDKILLIDTGEKQHGHLLVKKLQKLGIERIDYLILTHPDKDHIGGAYDIINNFEIGTVFQSALQKGSALQEILNSEIEKHEIFSVIPNEQYEFTLGDLTCTIYSPKANSYKKDNNYSLMTLIKHEELSFFFAGDAEKKLLEEAIEYSLPKVTLYKLPHHGRANSMSVKMIEKLSPRFAVITSDQADTIIVRSLEKQNTQTFYTFGQDIRFISDGKVLKLY